MPSEQICTLIHLSKCVTKKNIILREQPVYVFDQHVMDIILYLGTFDEVDLV
jgi:hypothetical protein